MSDFEALNKNLVHRTEASPLTT